MRQGPPVHKSPSLTVAVSWLPTVISSLLPTVPKTICFSSALLAPLTGEYRLS